MISRVKALTSITAAVAILCAAGIYASAQSESVCVPAEAVADGSESHVDGEPLLICPVLPEVPEPVRESVGVPEPPEVDPVEAISVELAVDQRLVLPEDRDALLIIELTGSDSAETTRLPVSMAIVIDGSGSMRGDKIDDARAAARELVDELEPGDVVTVISYNESATTHLDRFEIGESRRDAQRAVRRIRARGNTCISCGLQAAYTALREAPDGHVRRVVMLSDGNANRGITAADGLQNQASDAMRLSHVPTSTIGLGNDYNEDLMTAVAAGGAGQYYFLPEAEAMGAILDRELAALASTVALDVVLEVHPEDDVTIDASDIAGARRDGVDLIINLGQVSAGEQRRILVPLGLPEGELGQVASARLSYADVTGRAGETARAAEIGRTDNRDAAIETQDPRVSELAGRWASAADLEAAMAEFNEGRRDEARERLRRRARDLRSQSATLDSSVLEAEAVAVEELIDALGDEDEEAPDAPTVRSLQLQNQARSNEVRSGAMPADMYHQQTHH